MNFHFISISNKIRRNKTFSNFIPSVISSSVIIPLPSSNEITPSLPTFAKASAIRDQLYHHYLLRLKQRVGLTEYLQRVAQIH
jgi:hypothetical protein